MSGFEACRALKSDVELCMIPVSVPDRLEHAGRQGAGLGPRGGGLRHQAVRRLRASRPRSGGPADEASAGPADRTRPYRSADRAAQPPGADGAAATASGPASSGTAGGCRSSWPTSTISSGSTTATATTSATRCSRKWPGPSPGNAAKWICRPATAATSSPSSSPTRRASRAMRLAERCREEVAKVSVTVNGRRVTTTASFGVADAAGESSAEALIRQADEALYRAKQSGRNTVHGCEANVPALS